ncbi:MAG: hypothetical protein ACREPX_09280 [Rhodanobacteraceae bacterium]
MSEVKSLAAAAGLVRDPSSAETFDGHVSPGIYHAVFRMDG